MGTGRDTAVAQTDAALVTVGYQPNLNAIGADTVSVQVDDRGNVGSGGPLTDSKSIPITIGAVNDAPSVTTNTGLPLPQVGFALTPVDGTQPFVFTVRRLDASQAVQVPLAVTDARGDWSTFVGGGAGSF